MPCLIFSTSLPVSSLQKLSFLPPSQLLELYRCYYAWSSLPLTEIQKYTLSDGADSQFVTVSIEFDRLTILLRALNYYVTKLQNMSEDEDLSLSNFVLIDNDLQLEIDNAAEVIGELDARNADEKQGKVISEKYGHVLCRALRTYLHFLKAVKEGIEEGLEGTLIPMPNVEKEIELLEKTHLPEICPEQSSMDSAKIGWVPIMLVGWRGPYLG